MKDKGDIQGSENFKKLSKVMQNLNRQSWTPIDIVGSNIKVNERSGNNVSQIFPHERGT